MGMLRVTRCSEVKEEARMLSEGDSNAVLSGKRGMDTSVYDRSEGQADVLFSEAVNYTKDSHDGAGVAPG